MAPPLTRSGNAFLNAARSRGSIARWRGAYLAYLQYFSRALSGADRASLTPPHGRSRIRSPGPRRLLRLALSLAALLRASSGLPGPPAAAAALDHGQATATQHRSDAEANRVRETIEFADRSGELWTVAVAGAAATPLSTVHCGSKRRTTSTMAIDEISLIENMAADDPLAHLGRIGLRRFKIALQGTVAGDLIVELMVTQRLARFDVFGYPAVKRYWLRHAGVDKPTHPLASGLPAIP